MTTLRLLKVMVQPVFVVDDGTALRELTAQPVPVPAADWPTFATTEFLDGMRELQAKIDEGGV